MHTQLYSENLNRKCSFEYLDLDKKIMFFFKKYGAGRWSRFIRLRSNTAMNVLVPKKGGRIFY
jgi:hypothetical protein